MNEEIPIQIPANLVKITTMRDGAIRLTFDSQQGLQPEIKTRFFENHDQFGWLSFLASEQNITADMVSDLPKIEHEKDEVSPSTRLRNVLYRVWEFKKKPTKTFNEFYNSNMESLCEHFKSKMN